MSPTRSTATDSSNAGRAKRHRESSVPPALLLVPLLLGAIVWFPTASFDFTLDDHGIAWRNRQVERFDIGAMFRSTLRDGSVEEEELGSKDYLYRPLPKITFALNRLVSGEQPWSYHLANVLLHGAAAALVLVLMKRLGFPPFVSAFAAVFFLLHPVHVEAVANVKHREEILAALGFLAAWLAAIRAREARTTAAAAGWAAAAGAAVFLALLSKESAIAAVVLIPLADSALFPTAPSARRRRLSVAAALLAGSAAWLALRVPVVGWRPTWGVEVFFMPDEGTWTRLLTSAKVWAAYYFGRGAVLHSYPIGFSSRSEVVVEAGFPSMAAFAGLLLLAGSLFAAGMSWRRGGRRWAFWVLFFWITLLPSSNVLAPIGTVGAFRLLYLPSLAWGVLVGGLVNFGISKIPLSSRRLAATAAIVLPALLFAAASLRESLNWRNDETVNASDLARTLNPRARFVEAMAATDAAAREEWLEEVVAIMEARRGSARGMETSLLARTYTELGDLSLARGSVDAADRRADQALAVLAPDPRFHHYRIFPLTLRARVAAARGDESAELAAWEACISSDPNYARSYLEIARIRAAREERGRAVEILQRGIAALDASGFEELRNDRDRLAVLLEAVRSSRSRP